MNRIFPMIPHSRRSPPTLGGFFMSWLETLGSGAGHRLRLSHRKEGGAAWFEPR